MLVMKHLEGSVYSPPLQGGWLRHKENGPVPLKAQTGWLVISRSLLIDAREALLIEWLQSVRCAAIYKEASQYDATTPSAPFKGGFAASLELGAFTPPCKGREYV